MTTSTDDPDLALTLRRCLSGGSAVHWEAFIHLAQPTIAGAVLRTLSRGSITGRETADDLIQDTFLKLCADDYRVLRNFRGDGTPALRAYIKVIASSIAMDYFRSGQAKPQVNLDDVEQHLTSFDRTDERLEKSKLLGHVERCLSTTDARSHRVFWLYHRQGLRPKEIAALPDIGMGMSGVETAVYRLTSQVRDCLRKAGVLESARMHEGGRA